MSEMRCIMLVLIDASNKSMDHTLIAFSELRTHSGVCVCAAVYLQKSRFDFFFIRLRLGTKTVIVLCV